MPGERTVLRVFLDQNDNVSFDVMIDRSISDKTLAAIVGMIDFAKMNILNMFKSERLTDVEINDIRNLLDGDVQGD